MHMDPGPTLRTGRYPCGRRSGAAGGPNPFQGAGDARDPLADLVGRDAREREAEARPAAVQHEVGPRHEGDLLLERGGVEISRVHVVLESQPQEVAAAGLDEVCLGNLLAKRLNQRVTTLAEGALDERDVLVERPGAAQL